MGWRGSGTRKMPSWQESRVVENMTSWKWDEGLGPCKKGWSGPAPLLSLKKLLKLNKIYRRPQKPKSSGAKDNGWRLCCSSYVCWHKSAQSTGRLMGRRMLHVCLSYNLIIVPLGRLWTDTKNRQWDLWWCLQGEIVPMISFDFVEKIRIVEHL